MGAPAYCSKANSPDSQKPNGTTTSSGLTDYYTIGELLAVPGSRVRDHDRSAAHRAGGASGYSHDWSRPQEAQAFVPNLATTVANAWNTHNPQSHQAVQSPQVAEPAATQQQDKTTGET